MSIGKWIIIAFVIFTSFIATLVVICVRQNISLVSKNYYSDELQYQQQIVKATNTASLLEKPSINVSNQKIEIQYADMHDMEEGKLNLFCPSNEKMDRTFDLTSNTQKISFDTEGLKKGMYRARMQWTMKGKSYYHEQIIFI